MKRLICLFIGIMLACSLCACQQAVHSEETPDHEKITEDATTYFEQMITGDFETLYNALPKGVKEQTSVELMQSDWNDELEKLGGMPEDASPDVSCYVPEHTDQIRVEFVIPCEKGDFKVFINYSPDGSLYNYTIWKNKAE